MVTEEHHHHGGQHGYRNRQQQDNPKTFPVFGHHLFVVAGMSCGGMPSFIMVHVLIVTLGSGLFLFVFIHLAIPPCFKTSKQ